MNIEERRNIAKGLYKDLKDFESFLEKSPKICKFLAEEILDFVNEYDEENRSFLKSVCDGKNLKEFVEMLAIENIIHWNENRYILYAKCWHFNLGSSVQITLTDNWLIFNFLRYEAGYELRGLKVKPVEGQLNTYTIKSIKDLDTMPEDELIDLMEW